MTPHHTNVQDQLDFETCETVDKTMSTLHMNDTGNKKNKLIIYHE